MKSHVHEVLKHHILVDGYPFVMDLEQSQGSFLVDRQSKRKYIDMFGMYASIAIGFNHPKLLNKQGAFTKVVNTKLALSDVYCEEFSSFMEVFSRVAIPSELSHTFFIEGGALAVENALKTAFDWKQRKNIEAGRSQQATKVIHFQHAFHGRSGYTISLTNTADPRKTMFFPKFDWPRIECPSIHFPMNEENIHLVKEKENRAIQQIYQAIKQAPHECAALIIEPIQGEGGDHHFREEFFIHLRKICDEEEIFLLFDEVQTGVGITGKMWAYQHYNMIPDGISFGKKSQVCGILVGSRVEEVENCVFKESSRINSTFGGNLVDMTRFKIILEIIEEDNLIENARVQGGFLQKKLFDLQEKYPDVLSNARGRGLFCAFDCNSPETRDLLVSKNLEKGLITLPCGVSSLRFRPNLAVEQEIISQAIEICEQSVKEIRV